MGGQVLLVGRARPLSFLSHIISGNVAARFLRAGPDSNLQNQTCFSLENYRREIKTETLGGKPYISIVKLR